MTVFRGGGPAARRNGRHLAMDMDKPDTIKLISPAAEPSRPAEAGASQHPSRPAPVRVVEIAHLVAQHYPN
jgi:hypothetical protein